MVGKMLMACAIDVTGLAIVKTALKKCHMLNEVHEEARKASE